METFAIIQSHTINA